MKHTLELLESRRMFAVFNGTPGSDTIVSYIDTNGRPHVVINDTDLFTFDSQININGLGGDDNIFIEGVRALSLVQIDAGAGSNRIYIGNGDFDTHIKGNIDVLGHQGTDFVVVEDASDGTNDPNLYEYTSFTFRKHMSSSGTLSLFSVDEVIVNASDDADEVRIISTAASSSLIWNGNGGIDTFYVGNGDVGLIKGRVFLNGNGGHDTVNVLDHGAPGSHTYDVFNHTITRGGTLAWEIVGTIEALNLVASSGDDIINVRTATGSITTGLSGRGGNDTFNLFTDGYTSSVVQSPIQLFGEAGNDTVNWNVQSGQHLYTVKSAELNGPLLPTYVNNSTETLVINGGSGNELYVIHSTRAGTHTIVNAGEGRDAIGVGGSFGLPWTLDDIAGAITINGGGGLDVVDFVDSLNANQRSFAFNGATISPSGSASATYGSVEEVRVHAGSAADAFEVNGTPPGTPLVLHGNGGADSISVNETAPDGPVTIDTGAEFDFVNLNLDNAGFAHVRFADNDQLQVLDIGAGGLVTIEPGLHAALLTRVLSIADQGRFDVTDGHLLIDYTIGIASPEAELRSWLIAGRNGGMWNGASGIVSSEVAPNPGTTIGYAQTAQLFSTFPITWAGHNVDGTTLGVSFTRAGDANLDGTVGLADFNRLATHFGRPDRSWVHGDFNYDGRVNLQDFNMLASNFGQIAPTGGTITAMGEDEEALT